MSKSNTKVRFTVLVVTFRDASASEVGDTYGATDGVSWRNAVDRCDGNGYGRVFIDCDSEEIASNVTAEMDGDERIESYQCYENDFGS